MLLVAVVMAMVVTVIEGCVQVEGAPVFKMGQ